MKKGIDVSAWQGVIDWDRVKSAGIEFAILKAGSGKSSVDRQFERNAAECKRVGIPFGAYWFSYAYTVSMARDEAKCLINLLKDKKVQYPVCFDYEYDSIRVASNHGVSVTKQLVSAMAKAFLDEIKSAGYIPANYTNLDFSNRFFDNEVKNKYDFWAARYTSQKVDIVNQADLWQYSSKGAVSGISGYVDMNYAIKDYGETPRRPDDIVPTDELADVYDYGFYCNQYEDLREAFGTDRRMMYEHFKMCGMKEARQGCMSFDPVKYRERNLDLDAAFGDDWQAYYYHYIMYGKKEIENGERAKFM